MKEKIGNIFLVLISIPTFYILYKMSAYSLNNTVQMIKKKLVNSNISDPIVIWINSTIFIVLVVALLLKVLPDRYSGFISKFRSFLATFASLYLIYIGPIILLLLLLLFNASIMHITLVISVISFIGLTFKKGKKLYFKIYDKVSEIF